MTELEEQAKRTYLEVSHLVLNVLGQLAKGQLSYENLDRKVWYDLCEKSGLVFDKLSFNCS